LKSCGVSIIAGKALSRTNNRRPKRKLKFLKPAGGSACYLEKGNIVFSPARAAASGYAAMYKRIVIPTDGSDLSRAAAQAGVAFAGEQSAEVLGIFVAPEFVNPIYVEMIPPSEAEYKAALTRIGQAYLDEIRDDVLAAGLSFTGFIEFSDSPSHEIVALAEAHRCDLIFMGSHGHSGLGQLLLGSVTSKVLATCRIPVLVYRTPRP
jgi:nucleotide-binding universal stress UspA family protein